MRNLWEFPESDAQREEGEALRSQVNIGRAVLDERLNAGLSQMELARRAGTTQARVSEIESMKGDPKLSTLSRVARCLGCMIDMVPIPQETATATTWVFTGYAPMVSVTTDAPVAAGPTNRTVRPLLLSWSTSQFVGAE